MIRLDLAYFYRLRGSFEAVRGAAPDVPVSQVWGAIYNAETDIKSLLEDQQVGVTFRRAAANGWQLYRTLAEITSREWDKQYTQFDRAQVLQQLGAYETVLTSEFSVADAYFVVPKPGLDSPSLISRGEVLFPEALPRKVPAAIADLREAGRCIAYELCTAAGFHLMRAVETVLRRYWEVITGNAPKPKQRNIGTYLRGFKKLGCGDDKVIGALTQLKDLHRNVIIHTDEALSLDKAISLLGMARSVVDAMLDQIPEPPVEMPPPAVETPEFPNVSLETAAEYLTKHAETANEAAEAKGLGSLLEELMGKPSGVPG
jgi:hypothetical protein